MQFRVGAMVLGSIGIALFLLFVFYSDPALLHGETTIYIRFTEAPGVKPGTPVKKSGVLIGRVSNVQLRDEQRDVLVTVKIDRRYAIHQNEIVQISTESLLGDSMLEFVPIGPGAPGEPITDGALIDGRVERGALEAIESAAKALEVVIRLEDDITIAMEEFRISAQKFGRLSEHLDAITTNNEDQLRRIVQKSEVAMDSFNLAMLSINEVVADEQVRRDLKASLAGVPEMVAQTQSAMVKFGQVADRAGATLDGAEKFTASLDRISSSSEQMSVQMQAVFADLEELTRDLLVITQAVNEQKGTLGQLVHNPDLYQRLNRAADNVEQVTFRLRPVVEDVRVFTDKIARDPGRLGLKGALERSGSGVKFPFLGRFRPAPQPGGPPLHSEYQFPPLPAAAHPMPEYHYQWRPDRPPPQTFWQPQ